MQTLPLFSAQGCEVRDVLCSWLGWASLERHREWAVVRNLGGQTHIQTCSATQGSATLSKLTFLAFFFLKMTNFA